LDEDRRDAKPGDDELVARIAGGDEAAMQTLVERWERPVHAFLHHMLGSADDAEDLAQDTFLRVFVRSGDYRAEGRFRSWLLRIAGNLARSHLRRRKLVRWVRFEPLWHDRASAMEPADRTLETEETGAAVRRALATLPWRQRQALVLKRFEGMSYREIADVLDTTVPGVESLLQRATASLRRTLGGERGAS
jgi:RNA polymerase sigma-70 factor (ECF subfamily)